MTNRPPPVFVVRTDLIATLPTKGLGERAAMLASLRWVNERAELWPVVENWAHVAGLTVRGLQRVLSRLVSCGILVVVHRPPPGTREGVRYRIPVLLTPDLASGVSASAEPPNGATPTPDRPDADPRPGVIQSARDQPTEQPTTTAVGVVALLPPEWRTHPNATPERLAWLERVAHTKENPTGFAITCIREGWPVPPPTKKQVESANQAKRAAHLARFDLMPAPQPSGAHRAGPAGVSKPVGKSRR